LKHFTYLAERRLLLMQPDFSFTATNCVLYRQRQLIYTLKNNPLAGAREVGRFPFLSRPIFSGRRAMETKFSHFGIHILCAKLGMIGGDAAHRQSRVSLLNRPIVICIPSDAFSHVVCRSWPMAKCEAAFTMIVTFLLLT
jgi:hypothetical protein